MIRSIPNPPMDNDDVIRFRKNLEMHIRGEFKSTDEMIKFESRKKEAEAITKKIIDNCGGKNPLLGY